MWVVYYNHLGIYDRSDLQNFPHSLHLFLDGAETTSYRIGGKAIYWEI